MQGNDVKVTILGQFLGLEVFNVEFLPISGMFAIVCLADLPKQCLSFSISSSFLRSTLLQFYPGKKTLVAADQFTIWECLSLSIDHSCHLPS